jgi:hypothetical protein
VSFADIWAAANRRRLEDIRTWLEGIAMSKAKIKAVKAKSHKIAINIPEELYRKIDRRAKRAKVSFSDQAVKLLDCGEFDYEESEMYDADPDS